MASRGDRRRPAPPEITVSGGPAGSADPPALPRRRALPRVLLALAAVGLVGAAVLDQRRSPPPEPSCPEPCLRAGTLVVGAALPVTGVLAPFGQAQQRGVERAVAEVEADGGLEVAGTRRRLDLLVRDTRSEPDVAGQEALVLVRGPYDLLGLIGPCSPPLAMVRVAETRLVPLVTGCSPLPALGPAPVRSTWEVAPAEPERATAVFRALQSSPRGRVGLFLSNDRSAVPWESAATRAGAPVLATYRPQGRDWSAAVAQAAADGVEVVVAVTQPPEGIGLWQELDRQGVRPRAAYASEAGLGSAWHAAVGGSGDGALMDVSLTDGVLTDLVHPVDGPATPEQVDDAVAVLSAELTRVLLDGLERARATSRPELRAALAGATAQVAGTDVRFLGDRASRLPVRLARWDAGRLVPLPS